MRIVAEEKSKVKVGEQFGRWTVIGLPFFVSRSRRKVVCECECGTVSAVFERTLLEGLAQSCGCYCRDVHLRHGSGRVEDRDKLYRCYGRMRERCYRTSHKSFKDYGGRGIFVCEEWNDFVKFRDWALANGYRDGLSIDRINNDGPYSPENCQWSTMSQQLRNTRRNTWLTAFGESKIAMDWASDDRCAVTYGSLLIRLRKGMSHEEAISSPPRG